jgi:hypothetical protein
LSVPESLLLAGLQEGLFDVLLDEVDDEPQAASRRAAAISGSPTPASRCLRRRCIQLLLSTLARGGRYATGEPAVTTTLVGAYSLAGSPRQLALDASRDRTIPLPMAAVLVHNSLSDP